MTSRENFISNLFALTTVPESEIPAASETLMKSLVKFGSETADNLNCKEHIEYGHTIDNVREKPVFCFKVKNRNVMLADVLWELEGISPSPELRVKYPEMLEEEWDAIFRFVVLLFNVFQRDVSEVSRE